jgi:hypothetical protein
MLIIFFCDFSRLNVYDFWPTECYDGAILPVLKSDEGKLHVQAEKSDEGQLSFFMLNF